MARTDIQVNFRIPAELKSKLEQAAKESGRSITSELVHRLEFAFNFENQMNEVGLSNVIEKTTEKFDIEKIFRAELDTLIQKRLETANLQFEKVILEKLGQLENMSAEDHAKLVSKMQK